MKDLENAELSELNGGGFAYDVGCAWRYIGNFTKAYIASGGPFSPVSFPVGVAVAEANGCPD
jgi:hypothetical protein